MSDYETDSDVDAITSEEEVAYTSDEETTVNDSDGVASGSDEEDGAAGPVVDGLWVPIIGADPGPTPVPFTAVPGPKHAPAPASKPIAYLDLFFTAEFLHGVVTEINRYAEQWVANHQHHLRAHPRGRVHLWLKQGPATVNEFRAFLGLVFNMGLLRKPSLAAYWDSTHPSQGTPWFIQHFSRDRFQLYLKFMHFADLTEMPAPGDPDFKLFKIQPVITHFQRTFRHHYHPGCNIAIDESMVGYKGKTPYLRQFMPLKRHARFGIKLWCLCESDTGYTSTFEVYKGKHDAPEPEGMTHALVMRLMQQADFLNQGHHLGLDNFFTSPNLFQDLYRQQTVATGTVRAGRKGLPKAILKKKLAKQEVSERRKGNLLCVVYQDKTRRPVLLSTVATAGFTTITNRRAEEVQKPKIVTIYNNVMGGVDLSDLQLYKYLTERRTMKWTTKVAFYLFGRAVMNSYLVYKAHTTNAPILTRYQFMISVVESLAGDYYPPGKVVRHRRSAAEIEAARADPQPFQIPPAPQAGLAGAAGDAGDAGHKLLKLDKGKRRICVAGHGSRVRSSYWCPTCDVGLCITCYVDYHKRPRV